MFRILESQHPALPAVCMLIAVTAYSAIPILFKLGSAGESPFLFTGVWMAITGMGLGTTLLIVKRRFLFRPDVVRDISARCKTWLMLVSLFTRCGFVLFALGLVFIDASMAAILYATSPLYFMLLMSFLFRGTKRYTPITWATLVFVILAIAGAALVILSHNDAPAPLREIGSGFASIGTWFGVLLVVMAAVCQGTVAAGTFKMGVSLAEKSSHREGLNMAEFVFVLLMNCVCLAIGGIVLCLIGIIASETLSPHQLLFAILGGLTFDLVGLVTFRVANLKTVNLGVNAIAFATPLVALIWLWMFSMLGVSHLDYLFIGAMGIVASNLLINARADMRAAYSALVMSLWAFGTLVYFFDGYTTDVPLELPVTIFILVLSFRVDRLARRTSQEEEWLFEAFRRLELQVATRQFRDDAWKEPMLKIDKHDTLHELTAAYEKLTKYLVAQMKNASASKGTMDEITGIRYLVDNLAHSRQQGAHFGEIVAIALTGALIVTGLLFFNGEREIYGEIISFVLCAVVVFLFFNILDLQKDRRGRILQYGGKKYDGEYVVKFDDKAGSRKAQQWISVVTSAVIVLVFVWLFTWDRAPF